MCFKNKTVLSKFPINKFFWFTLRSWAIIVEHRPIDSKIWEKNQNYQGLCRAMWKYIKFGVIPAQSGRLNFSMCPLKYWEGFFEYLTIWIIQKIRTSQIEICYFSSAIIAALNYICFIFHSIRFIESLQSFSEPSIFVYSFNFSLLSL